jgi:hypothetical protein
MAPKLFLTLPASLINPAWREVDSQIRRLNGLPQREIATFGDIHLPADLDPSFMRMCFGSVLR